MTEPFHLKPRTSAEKIRYALEQLDGVYAQDSAGQTRLFGVRLLLGQVADEVEDAPLRTPATPEVEPLPSTATDAEQPFEGAEVTRTPDGYAWRCNGGQGCDGWVGLGHASESAAWAEFRDHVEREHAPATADPATPGEESC